MPDLPEPSVPIALDYALRRREEVRCDTRQLALMRALQFLLWILVGLCCGLPLLWLLYQVTSSPRSVAAASFDSFHLRLLGRTLGYNLAVGFIATFLAIPAAIAIGRGRGLATGLLAILLPVALLMPSIAYAYGWSQFLRLIDVQLEPAGWGDVVRCILTLALWLWPLAAGVIGLALRRVDVSVQQQALLDGALWRITAHQLAGPIAAAVACVAVLAMQEFAVYEPTGISVVATEVRIVFETGLFSSAENPIDAPMDAGAWAGSDAAARAAAAVGVALPLLIVIGILAVVGLLGVRRISAAEDIDAGPWPRALNAGAGVKIFALGLVLVTLLVPVVSMLASLQRPIDPVKVWRTFQPQVSGSLQLAAMAGGVALLLAFLSAIRPARGLLALSLVTFILGGQILAIALIRIYNRPWLNWVYDAPPVVVMAYVARFGWIALLAAAMTHSPRWRPIREMAAVDGADDLQAAFQIVWRLAWPVLAAGAVLVGVLSLTEVPATVLLSPLHPQPLVPLLMTWVHMLRYDDMLEGALLLMAMAGGLGVGVVALVALGLKLTRGWKMEDGRWRKRGTRGWRTEDGRWRKTWALVISSILYPLSSILVSLLAFCTAGCDDATQPDAIWLKTGAGPGEVIYPRAITYSVRDDTFFVIDRLARVQQIDREGRFLHEWRMPDHQTGKPVGISVGPDGNVYVPDTHYQRVMVYSPRGELLRQWGELGKEPGEFIYPTDVAFDSAGNVFVSEYGDNDRIQVFDPSGKFLYAFGSFGQGEGQFSRPQSMVIDREDQVYVTDACNHRIAVFKSDGTFLRNMGSVGSEPGQFRYPYGLAESDDGRSLIVCEFGNNRIQQIDKRTGASQSTWGAPGHAPGELAYPWAVAVDRTGRVVAVDAGNNRLQVFNHR